MGDWICQGQPRYNRKDRRFAASKIREAAGRYQSFIGEVRNHYNVVNTRVYWPLSSLGLNTVDNAYEYPSWKSRLRVNGYIQDDFLTDMARHHISNDESELLNEMLEYMKRFKLHTRNVESLPEL